MNLLDLPVLPADERIAYGDLPSQFGDLWLPATEDGRLLPVVAFFHGGWWKSDYDLGYAGYLCRALKQLGIAVWSMEYRRIGSTGGGWPATFQDASAGFEFLASLARRFPLDLSRVAVMGHSAGGHLAFWIAGRTHLPIHTDLMPVRPVLVPSAAVSLAGAVGLREALALSSTPGFAHVRDRVVDFIGGTPAEVAARYQEADPAELGPLPVPQLLIQGTEDDQIPPALPYRWLARSVSSGSRAFVRIIPDADHFDVVDPRSKAWPAVAGEVKALFPAEE